MIRRVCSELSQNPHVQLRKGQKGKRVTLGLITTCVGGQNEIGPYLSSTISHWQVSPLVGAELRTEIRSASSFDEADEAAEDAPPRTSFKWLWSKVERVAARGDGTAFILLGTGDEDEEEAL